MPIATELSRIIAAKAAIRASIEAKGVPVPIGDPIEAYAAYIDAITGGSATVPSAFTAGMWTLTPGNTQATVNITSLPSNGGSALTALQYRIDGGTAVTLSGTGTGSRTITGLTNGAEIDVELRAVNAIGNGAWGDLKSVTPVAPGVTYIRFGTLSNMAETGDATNGWIYTGSAANGTAGASDYSLASGVAGGFAVQVTRGGTSIPVVGVYNTSTGVWDGNFEILAYHLGGSWICEGGPGFTNLVTTAQTSAADDWVRFQFDATNGYTISIARAATPTTWLPLAVGTRTRSATWYPRVNSFDQPGAVFTDPQVA